MTKKDFELMARVFSNVERMLVEGDSPLTERLVHRGMVMAMAIEIAKTHPRFNRAQFEKASLPIYSAMQADRVRESLGA